MPAPMGRLSAALLAAFLAGCSPHPEQAPAPGPAAARSSMPPAAPAEEPLLVMADLMALVVDPAAGVLDPETHRDPLRRPHTAEAWQAAADAATALERTAQELQRPGWSLGRAEWLRSVAEMREGAQASASAAHARDLRRWAEAGVRLRGACTGCHGRYAPDLR